jgi:DNA-binding MarR family transcriptional regulator
MSKVWEMSSRRDGELLVLLAIADHANDDGAAYPSIPKLAQKARLTERQARKVIRKLEEAGELRVERSNGGRNRCNRYFIVLPGNPEQKTLLKEPGFNNPVPEGRKTLSPRTGAYNRHITVNKRVSSKAAPLTDPAVTEFKDFWAKTYHSRCGVGYHFKDARDDAHIKALLTSFDLPTLKLRAEQFFQTDDEWVQTQGGFTIGVFRSQINKINSIRPKRRRDFENEGMLEAL